MKPSICYSEFASSVPVAGSAYTYGYATLGELVAWVIGWDLVLEYALGAATVAVGWSGNVMSLLADFGIQIPHAISGDPGSIVPPGDDDVVIVRRKSQGVRYSIALTMSSHSSPGGSGATIAPICRIESGARQRAK